MNAINRDLEEVMGMTANKTLANVSRSFLKQHKVYRYRMKKVEETSDDEVIRVCHWFCEENNLTEEFIHFREKTENAYE